MRKSQPLPSRQDLWAENQDLRKRLQEAEDTLQAIRDGEVDALLVAGPRGDQVFTLEGAEHGYRLLVETMNEGAMTLNREGVILYANAQFSGMVQLPQEKIIGSEVQRFFSPEHAGAFERLLHSEQNDRAEFTLLPAQGEAKPVLIAMSIGLEQASGALCMVITDLTEQKHVEELQKAQNALEQSEQQLRIAVETARLGSWKRDLVSGKVECSRQFKANLGLPPDAVVDDKILSQMVQPEDRERMRSAVETAQAQHTAYECECRINRPDGTLGWIIASGRSLEGADGRPTHMIGVTLDITARKEAEQLLRDAQARVEATLASAEIGTWTWDISNDRLVADKNLARFFGVTEEDARGGPLSAYFPAVHPDDRERVRSAMQAVLDQPGGEYEVDYRLVQNDGCLRWVTARGQVEHDAEGKPIRFPGVVIDITARKNAEDSLRLSEQRFRTLTDAIPQLTWTCLPNGSCDYLSRQWVDYTGIPMEPQLGEGWLERLHPDDVELVHQVWREAVAGRASYDLEFRLQGADAIYRWFKTRGIPVRDAEGGIIRWFGTCTDVQDIVAARQVIARDREELEKLVHSRTESLAETTEQLNSFCYSIAHDLRAPLRAQNGFARILLEEYGDAIGETGRGYARRIITAAQKLESLVTDLLSHVSLSRGDLPLENVEMISLLAHVRADLSEQIQQQNAHVHIGPVAGTVRAHEPSLNLIVANLISNAVKYVAPDVPPEVKIFTEPRGDFLRLWVEDHGIGIAPEHHEKIFGVFERLHSSDTYPGTGIGLALVHKGIQRMGGQVGLESELGKGSRFWIELPVGTPMLPAE